MSSHLMPTYNRAPVAFEKGEGCYLISTTGERYLDCVAGIATDALGHCHPKLVAALKAQADKLWHVSNMFRIEEQEKLADRLCELTFADVAFFNNSGTEAVETALKLARRYHVANGQPERIDIITFEGAFHGRTYGAVNAGGNPAYLDGFGPRMPGFVYLPYGDHDALKAAISSPTAAAVLIEPVQGEGGVRPIPDACLKGLRDLCTQYGVLLMLDEVQSGMGRTGKLFAHEWAGITPDVMTTAKALGGGIPIGACLATREAAKGMTAGVHGTTFGGNPLSTAVALVALDEIAKPETLAHVQKMSNYLVQQLEGLKQRYPDVILEVRGRGLLLGLKLAPNNREFMALAREKKLLLAGGGDNVVRVIPPLIITEDQVRDAIEKLDATCAEARAKVPA
jgi:acetylornithine/N-succinyldiaminopimelate aminotransferase